MDNYYTKNLQNYSNGYPGVVLTDPSDVAIQSLTAQEAASLGNIMCSGGNNKNQKVHLRKAAGQVWSDPTLEEWGEDDFRVFCGDLGNEVTDEVLANAFRKFGSFLKAKVVRDKRSGKSKGYGFVSFGEPDDMLSALQTMNKKYVGNRPIRVMRSKWQEREINSEQNKQLNEILKTSETTSKTIRKFKKNSLKSKKKKETEITEKVQPARRGRGYFGPGGAARLAHYQYSGIKKTLPTINTNY